MTSHIIMPRATVVARQHEINVNRGFPLAKAIAKDDSTRPHLQLLAVRVAEILSGEPADEDIWRLRLRMPITKWTREL